MNAKELFIFESKIKIELINRYNVTGTRPSEFIFCLFEIDSLGRVATIHILGDENNKGPGYNVLSTMTPDIFKKYNFGNCSKKTINIPVLITSPDRYPSYAEKLKPQDIWKSLSVLSEQGNLINVSMLVYEIQAPIVDRVKSWPKEMQQIIDSTKKRN